MQALRREVELIFRHGFGNVQNLLFDRADVSIQYGSQRWRRLRRLRLGRARCCGAVRTLSDGGCCKAQRYEQQEDSWWFHLRRLPICLKIMDKQSQHTKT